MAGEDAAAAASPAAVRKPPKEEEDDDELDNVPLAISRAKKSGNASASKVKKEKDDDEEDNQPISRSRAKKGNEKQKGTTNSHMKASKVKKEEADSDDDGGDFTPTSQKKSAGAAGSNAKTSKVKKLKDEDLEDFKKRKKRVGVKEEANMAIVKAEKVKKERKVYELPGQKHDPPAERDPLRIFYESLYEQVPTSDMAATWLMEWGLLPLDVATKVFEKKQGQKLKSPVKTPVAKRKPSPTPTKSLSHLPSSAKKSVASAKSAGKLTSQKKRKASDDTDDDDDDDFMAPKTKTKRHKA